MPDVWTAFALLAIVLVVSALLSGVVERLPITFPMIFLALGVVLVERGLGLLAGPGGDGSGLEGQLCGLGPLAGGLVGLASVWLLKVARARTNVARQYRALYGVRVTLSAYVLGGAVGGSGFLAVFAAGAVI